MGVHCTFIIIIKRQYKLIVSIIYHFNVKIFSFKFASLMVEFINQSYFPNEIKVNHYFMKLLNYNYNFHKK